MNTLRRFSGRFLNSLVVLLIIPLVYLCLRLYLVLRLCDASSFLLYLFSSCISPDSLLTDWTVSRGGWRLYYDVHPRAALSWTPGLRLANMAGRPMHVKKHLS